MPPGEYYWTGWSGSHRVADGQVAPLVGGNANSTPETVPLEQFLAGLAETFRGVRPLDPYGPAPTPSLPPTPAPTPTPQHRLGQTINLVQEYGLGRVQKVGVKGEVAPNEAGFLAIEDSDRITAIVGTLDRAMPVEAPGPHPLPGSRVVSVYFRRERNGTEFVVQYSYTPQAGTLFVHDYERNNRFNLPAPPDFAWLLGLE